MDTRVAIVTGGSSGIGLEIVRRLLQREYAVVAVSRRASHAEASRKLVPIDGDVGEQATAERAVQAAVHTFGRLDLLVNNAGIFIVKPFVEYTAQDYERLLSTNLSGFVHMTQAALRVMQPGGHVVNIGTSLAQQPLVSAPSALPILIKGGIEAASRALAIEYAARGIRVNTIAAGAIDTPMHAGTERAFLNAMSPAGRLGTTLEVAEALLYLESASFVSGEVLRLDGGAHAGKWS